jgi:mannosyltransferase
VLILPPIATTALALLGIGSASFWRDEAATLTATRRPFPALLRMLDHVDAVHGAYYLMMWPLVHLAGTSEPVTRLPSAIAMGAAAFGVAAIGRRLASWQVGLLAGLVFAVLPLTSRFGQEARSYALVTAVAVLTSYLLIRAVDEPVRRWWLAYALSLAALGVLNLFGLLIVPAHAVTLAAARRRGHGSPGEPAARPVGCWAIAVASACAVALPIAVLSWHQRQQLAWLTKPRWSDFVTLATMFSGSTASVVLIAALVIAGAVLTGSRAGRQPASRGRHAAAPLLIWLSTAWLFLPPVLLFAVSEIKPVYLYRYVVFCLPALALATGAGLAALGRFWRIAAVTMIALLALPAQSAVRGPAGHGDNIRAAAQFLQAQARPGDALIFYKYETRDWAAAYPHGFNELRDIGLGQTAVAAGNLSGTEVSLPVLERRLRHVQRAWFVEVAHNWPDDSVIGPPRFRLTGMWLISDIALRLYERTRGPRGA